MMRNELKSIIAVFHDQIKKKRNVFFSVIRFTHVTLLLFQYICQFELLSLHRDWDIAYIHTYIHGY